MINRILIVKFWALGDLYMATPILTSLHNLYPGCEIDWLVDQDYAGALIGNPLIREVIPFDSGAWRRDYRFGRIIPYLRRSLGIRRRLVRADYNLVIVLTAEKWWTVWFKVAPVTVGLFPSKHAGILGKLYTYAIVRQPGINDHNTDHYLQAVRVLGASEPLDKRMICSPTVDDESFVDQFLLSQPAYVRARPLIVFHPGTSQPSKCWPTSSFAALADRLASNFNVVISGSHGDLGFAKDIIESSKYGNRMIAAMTGLSTLGHTTALVRRASAVVTGDTSLLHIASAQGIPLIGIYGSTRPGANAPLFGRNELLYDDKIDCAPCYAFKCPLSESEYMKCQKALSPDYVHQKLVNLLAMEEKAASRKGHP